MANDSVCGRGHGDGPTQVVSLLHRSTPPLPVPQAGNREYGLDPVGFGGLLSCSHTQMNWSVGPLGHNSE